MFTIAAAFAAAPVVIGVYAYVAYPAIVWMIATMRGRRVTPAAANEWPLVTITVPAYNAVSNIRATLERLLELDYPRDRLQLLVVSDGSTDGTDGVVCDFAHRGVELLRLPHRQGKTTAENAAVAIARGEIVVNVDASVLVPPGSLKPLVRAFDDPSVGVASSRDASVGAAGPEGVAPESTYVGYEMWLRDLETRAGSIVGASGSFYAFRRSIRSAKTLPGDLSWDFATPLVAREQGYRSVSVPAAVCFVPRTVNLRVEMKRKIRTMARGIRTLFYYRALMNPFRYGLFAFMLVSHKLLRWIPYLLAPTAVLGLAALATDNVVARALIAVIALGLVIGIIAVRQRESGLGKPVALAGFVVVSLYAGLVAWRDALRRAQTAMWEPTPRPEVQT